MMWQTFPIYLSMINLEGGMAVINYTAKLEILLGVMNNNFDVGFTVM